MAACDLLKDTAGYKLVLKAVLKGQIQQLVQQLADQTDEESIILTASMTDGAISHLGSDSVKDFLENHEDIKSEFLDFCFKNCQKERLQKNNHGSIKGVQTPSNQRPLLQPSFKQVIIRSSPSPRYSPYTVKRTPINKHLNEENISCQNAISTAVSKAITMVTKSPKVVTDDSIKAKDKISGNNGKFSSVNEMSKSRADQNVKTVKQSSFEEDTFKNQPQFQNEATFQSKTEKTLLDSDYGSMPGSDNSNQVIPEGPSVNSGFAHDADQADSDSTVDMDSYVTVKVEPESDQELEEAGESLDSHEHFSDTMQQSFTQTIQDDPDISLGQQQLMEWTQQESQIEPKKRFGTHCRDETKKKMEGALKKTGKSSERSNRTAAVVFRQYLIEKNEDVDFECIEKTKLAELLADFYINARTKDGTMYKFKSLTHMRYSLNQFFKCPPNSRNFDILHDEEFTHANKVFKFALQEILASGKGGISHHPIISNSDLITLYSSNFLSRNTPSGLQNRVQMNIRLTFCCEVNEKMAKMTKSAFTFAVDRDGIEYVYMNTHSNDTINLAKATEKASAQMKEDKDHPDLCPVRDFKLYLSKLHPLCDKLWQYPVEVCSDDELWYQNKHMGKNTLAKFMSGLSKAAGLSKLYTNQSIRMTGNSILNRGSYSLQEILTQAAVKKEKCD